LINGDFLPAGSEADLPLTTLFTAHEIPIRALAAYTRHID
jgi:hypothetical protein